MRVEDRAKVKLIVVAEVVVLYTHWEDLFTRWAKFAAWEIAVECILGLWASGFAPYMLIKAPQFHRASGKVCAGFAAFFFSLYLIPPLRHEWEPLLGAAVCTVMAYVLLLDRDVRDYREQQLALAPDREPASSD